MVAGVARIAGNCSADPRTEAAEIADVTRGRLFGWRWARRVKILVLAPHPSLPGEGDPLALRTVLEFLSARGHQVDVLTLHEGEDEHSRLPITAFRGSRFETGGILVQEGDL
jgi:hypothetical protein